MKPTDLHPTRCSTTAVLSFCAVAATASLSGCTTTDSIFPVVVGASMIKSDVQPCTDYASYYNYAGTPYYVQVPETGKITRRHEGMDFCAPPGAEVTAAASGVVVNVVTDNPYRGGRVTIRTSIEYRDSMTLQTLHLDALHITPKDGLRIGDSVKAGQMIGSVQPPGKAEIGTRSHVHFSAGPSYATWAIHTDPNRFWQKGPGIVSCFDPGKPPSDLQVVAPIKCK